MWTATRAVKIGDLEKKLGGNQGGQAQVQQRLSLSNAIIREGVKEGMQLSFINTTNVGDSRWGATVVDEDWHAGHLQRRLGGTTSSWRCEQGSQRSSAKWKRQGQSAQMPRRDASRTATRAEDR